MKFQRLCLHRGLQQMGFWRETFSLCSLGLLNSNIGPGLEWIPKVTTNNIFRRVKQVAGLCSLVSFKVVGNN